MSDQTTISLEITVGEQTFRIRVPEAEREHWRRIEAHTNRTLKQILDSGVVGGARALAMTAFQLATESEENRQNMGQSDYGRDQLAKLIRRIDEATASEQHI